MADRLRAGIPPWYVTKPTRSTQPCIPLESLNRAPALIGWGNGGNVTSAGWKVTPCDPVWHVSSRSDAVLVAQTAIRFLTLPYSETALHCLWIVNCLSVLLVIECTTNVVVADRSRSVVDRPAVRRLLHAVSHSHTLWSLHRDWSDFDVCFLLFVMHVKYDKNI